MNCSICGDPAASPPLYGDTCSRACARMARLTNTLSEIEHILRQLMLNQKV